jgi:hypothetical protein
MLNPIMKSAQSSDDMFDVDLYLFDASGGKGRHTGVFDQTGLISSIVSPSLPAARRSSASRRSPQQIGFIPARRIPDAPNKRKSCTAV